ncbi:hypothetical protein EVG20_g1427 [Dentipellis fragilis]|uniref:Uncharacterized protein n=1 Tax=Dentipellis fragilis TaxID=205917 RepID=A0A4Y9ZCV0_9AGAM|nr:hypothetical protein EVG20_g1427 [Dentipellis fragilis]
MSAATTPPREQSANCPGWNIIVGGPATHVYGFLLNQECIHHWAPIIYEEIHRAKMPSATSKNFQSKFRASCSMVTLMLPLKIYREFPSVLRLWRRLILFYDEGYLLVLKDNRTTATRTAELDPDDLEGIRRKLNLGSQRPKWHRIPL